MRWRWCVCGTSVSNSGEDGRDDEEPSSHAGSCGGTENKGVRTDQDRRPDQPFSGSQERHSKQPRHKRTDGELTTGKKRKSNPPGPGRMGLRPGDREAELARRFRDTFMAASRSASRDNGDSNWGGGCGVAQHRAEGPNQTDRPVDCGCSTAGTHTAFAPAGTTSDQSPLPMICREEKRGAGIGRVERASWLVGCRLRFWRGEGGKTGDRWLRHVHGTRCNTSDQRSHTDIRRRRQDQLDRQPFVEGDGRRGGTDGRTENGGCALAVHCRVVPHNLGPNRLLLTAGRRARRPAEWHVNPPTHLQSTLSNAHAPEHAERSPERGC